MRGPVLILGAICILSAPASSTTFIINPDRTGHTLTIGEAIAAAADGDTLILTNMGGDFRGDGNRDLDTLGKNLVIRSDTGNPEMCRIDCEGAPGDPHRGFLIDGGEGPDTVIEGITIMNGYVEGVTPLGGGISISGSSPTIINCRFIDNRTDTADGLGGGLYSGFGSPTLTDCVFSGNTASEGGGVFLRQSSPTFTRCSFSDSAATNGGGLNCFSQSSPTLTECSFVDCRAGGQGGGLYGESLSGLTDCTFSGNSASEGGGAYVKNVDPIIDACVFVANSATTGGGVFFQNSSPTILNATISANSADNGAGLFCFASSSPLVSGCTFTGNAATANGGGIACAFGSSPAIESTIIAFSAAGEAVYCDDSFGVNNPTLSCCDLFGNVGGDWTICIDDQATIDDNFSVDPLFCSTTPGADRNWTLQSISPCIPGNHPDGANCGLIGAWDADCLTTTLETSWGRIKEQFAK